MATGKHGRQVAATDADIGKNNRLTLMMDIHRRRQEKKSTTTNHVEKQESEEKMGKETRTCAQCGKEKDGLRTHVGKMVCGRCYQIRTAIKNNKNLVMDVYTEFHGAEQERLMASAAVLSKVRECISLDPAVHDDRIVPILHDLLQPASTNPDQVFVGEIAAHLGMIGLSNPDEVVKAIADLSMALAQTQQNCHDLTQANSQQQEQVNKLTMELTAGTIVGQVEEVGASQESKILDMALAVIRGDFKTIADTLELQRQGLQ